MGRTNNVDALVFTSTVRTSLSLPLTTRTIRPMRHCPLGKHSSISSTRSQISAFRLGFCHSCLSCKEGMYSLNHLYQKWSAKTCVCLYFFLAKTSSFTKEPGGKAWTVLCSSRLVGRQGFVIIRIIRNRTEWPGVQDRLHLVRTVASTSSSTKLSFRMAFMAVRVPRINLSQTPLACEALSGWNIHWHPFCSSSSWICFWLQLSMASLISLSAPTKLVPLSK